MATSPGADRRWCHRREPRLHVAGTGPRPTPAYALNGYLVLGVILYELLSGRTPFRAKARDSRRHPFRKLRFGSQIAS